MLPTEIKTQPIEVITTATGHANDYISKYKKAFRKVGFKNAGFINITNNAEAHSIKFVNRILKAHSVFLTGGEQFRLSTILGNTPVFNAIMQQYTDNDDFILAGTSAGAMVMPEIMIIEGETDEAMLAGSVRISGGLGFINRCIIDTHFIKRGRFSRLAEAVIMNPNCTGIGLGEDTALIIKRGNITECKGSGMVIIIDGHDIKHTNVPYADADTTLCVENLRVHILAKGNKYLLKERKFIAASGDLIKEKIAKQG